MFYFRFVAAWHGNDERHWSLNYHSARTNAWRGHAFERICLMHAKQIKKAIGIQGVEVDIYSWRWMPKSSNDTGVQIDMLNQFPAFYFHTNIICMLFSVYQTPCCMRYRRMSRQVSSSGASLERTALSPNTMQALFSGV